MSTQSPEPDDTTATRGRGETDRRPRRRRIRSAVDPRGGDGTAASLAGGAVLALALGSARRRRASALAVAGVALLGVGLERRQAGVAASGKSDLRRSHGGEAGARGTASDVAGRSDVDPRDVSGGADVAAAAHEGRVRFSADQDETGEPKPHLDGADPMDPRYADEDDPAPDDHVEVSLSATKTTHELGKAAGPDEEQAYPASEGTDPEPMSERAPPRYGQGAVANGESDGEETGAGAEKGTDDEPQ